MRGFLNINKPAGLTSHDVVARVRRLLARGIKVGHAGTLDPAATGVLPVAVGTATRLIEYLAEARKGYHGLVRLGRSTTTDDAEGETLAVLPVPAFSDELIEAAVAPLRGAILQTPPSYAALHHQGRRLYDLARAGQPVLLDPRPVQIYHLEWAWIDSTCIAINVECGKGTYIRSLARDLGLTLGCGAHLAGLTRTMVGPFSLASAVELNALVEIPSSLADRLLPPEIAVATWPAIRLEATETQRVLNGMSLSLPTLVGERARAHAPDGSLLALLRREGALWHPEKVLPG